METIFTWEVANKPMVCVCVCWHIVLKTFSLLFCVSACCHGRISAAAADGHCVIVTFTLLQMITSTMEDMFLSLFVCLSVSNFAQQLPN